MRINSKKIAQLMDTQGITALMLSLKIQITPVYMAKVLRDNECCEEVAHAIADVLNVKIDDIKREG